jgi:hypothetical protein
MAGRGGPTFLKRQKEVKRAAKAQAKREAKQARRDNRSEASANPDPNAGIEFFPESTEQDTAAGQGPASEGPADEGPKD